MKARKLKVKGLNAKEQNDLDISRLRSLKMTQSIRETLINETGVEDIEKLQATILASLDMVYSILKISKIPEAELEKTKKLGEQMSIELLNKNIGFKDALLEIFKNASYTGLLTENIISNLAMHDTANENIEHNFF